MRSYHPALYDWSHPVDSLWEEDRTKFGRIDAPPLTGDETAEVAIIGGGYCGLSAAYHLARAGIEARVLEAGAIGWGASGRNGGFCCIGATFLGFEELKAKYGEDQSIQFYQLMVNAVRLVEELARDENIDLKRQGDGIWTFAHKPSRVSELQSHAAALARVGIAAQLYEQRAFAAHAFSCAEQFGGVFEPIGFGLHPLAYCLGLARAAQKHGARLHSHSRVIGWEKSNGQHRLITRTGVLQARRIIAAGNGWLPEELVPELFGRVMPVMSNIVSTRPLTQDELSAQNWKTDAPASNTRALLSYFRLLPDKRLMFGGRGDTTGSPAAGKAMQLVLGKRLKQLFPAFAQAEITHSWRGFIAATMRYTPALGELPNDPSISFAFGCHGNGVAFMTWAGRELALRIAGGGSQLPAMLSGLPPRIPLSSLRLWGLRAMLLRSKISDAF